MDDHQRLDDIAAAVSSQGKYANSNPLSPDTRVQLANGTYDYLFRLLLTAVPRAATPSITNASQLVLADGTIVTGAQLAVFLGRTVGPNLTMVSPTWDAATPKVGSAALSGGSGSAAITYAGTHNELAVECWFKAASAPSSGNCGLVMFGDGTFGIGIQGGGTGYPMLFVNGYGSQSLSVCDGAWHHLYMQYRNNSGWKVDFYVDGVIQFGSGASGTISANPTIVVSAAGGSTTINTGATTGWGEVDQVNIYSAVQHLSNFTPSTTPPTASTPSLIAGWALDGNGNSV